MLASGKESDFYFDMKPSMLHPEGAALIAKAVLAEVRGSGATHVGGLEMGAVPITGALCQHSFQAGAPLKYSQHHGNTRRVEATGYSTGLRRTGRRDKCLHFGDK